MAVSPLSPRVSEKLIEVRKGYIQDRLLGDPDTTVPKSFTALSLSQDSYVTALSHWLITNRIIVKNQSAESMVR